MERDGKFHTRHPEYPLKSVSEKKADGTFKPKQKAKSQAQGQGQGQGRQQQPQQQQPQAPQGSHALIPYQGQLGQDNSMSAIRQIPQNLGQFFVPQFPTQYAQHYSGQGPASPFMLDQELNN